MAAFLYSHIYQSSCFSFATSPLFRCALHHLACSSLEPGPFHSFFGSRYPTSSPRPSILTPSLPRPSSPRLMPNGGIPLQPPNLTLPFCSGGAHFMQHDYISLATCAGVFWGLCNCLKNSIKTLYMFPCRIYLQIRKTLGV